MIIIRFVYNILRLITLIILIFVIIQILFKINPNFFYLIKDVSMFIINKIIDFIKIVQNLL